MAANKIYIILGRTVWTLFIAGFVFLLFAAMRSRQQEELQGVVVKIEAVDGKIFIDEKAVISILSAEANGKLAGNKLSQFNLRNMESRLRKEVWIEDAELYIDNEQLLHVKISERVPVARVFDVQGSSYYLDSAGMQLPLSNADRADVPVFTNIPVLNANNKSYYNATIADVIEMANLIRRDEFWNAQAASVNLVSGNKYEIYPAIGFHIVEWGTAEKTRQKLDKLKIFYREILAKRPLTEYSKLSVAFDDQVVAVKGGGNVSGADAARAVQVFRQLVNETRKEVNANAVQSERENGRIMPEYANSAKQEKPQKKPPASAVKMPEMPIEPKQADTSIPKPKAVMPAKTTNN